MIQTLTDVFVKRFDTQLPGCAKFSVPTCTDSFGALNWGLIVTPIFRRGQGLRIVVRDSRVHTLDGDAQRLLVRLADPSGDIGDETFVADFVLAGVNDDISAGDAYASDGKHWGPLAGIVQGIDRDGEAASEAGGIKQSLLTSAAQSVIHRGDDEGAAFVSENGAQRLLSGESLCLVDADPTLIVAAFAYQREILLQNLGPEAIEISGADDFALGEGIRVEGNGGSITLGTRAAIYGRPLTQNQEAGEGTRWMRLVVTEAA